MTDWQVEEEEDPAKIEVGDFDISSCAVTVIEDAIYILQEKRPGEAYDEAVYWMFYELDPSAERPFSLDWCCLAINQLTNLHFSANAIREKAVQCGLMPKEDSE